MTEQEKQILDHVTHMYGWHGGIGDPPDDETLLAVIRGTLEFLKLKGRHAPEPQG